MADRPRPAARLSARRLAGFATALPNLFAAMARRRCRRSDRLASASRDRRAPTALTKTLMALAALVLTAGIATGAGAVQPGERLADPALEARAREISKELRCLVCQNQSIDDSDAELAHDLRVLVRERLAAGDSDVEVVGYVVSRYGDFVLLRPPFKASTYALWLGPAAILVIGVLAVVVYYRRRGAVRRQPAALSESESRRLAGLLEDENR